MPTNEPAPEAPPKPAKGISALAVAMVCFAAGATATLISERLDAGWLAARSARDRRAGYSECLRDLDQVVKKTFSYLGNP